MDGAQRLQQLPTRLLSLAALRSDRLVNEALTGADARKWHYAVLAVLEEAGPSSQADLGTRTGIHRSDVVAVVNELTARGQVERRPDDVDRRKNLVSITAAGRKQLEKLDHLLAEVEDEVLAPLSPAQREQLTALLRLLT